MTTLRGDTGPAVEVGDRLEVLESLADDAAVLGLVAFLEELGEYIAARGRACDARLAGRIEAALEAEEAAEDSMGLLRRAQP